MKIKLHQQSKLPTRQQVNKLTNLIIILPATSGSLIFKQVPYGELLSRRIKRQKASNPDKSLFVTDMPNQNATHVSIGFAKNDANTFNLLGSARKLVNAHQDMNPTELGILVHGFDESQSEKITESVIAAILANAAEMPAYRKKKHRKHQLKQIRIFGLKVAHGYQRTFAEAEGCAMARSLSMQPSNMLTPGIYLQRVRDLARQYKWKLEFYDTKYLARKKAGAFLAVAQGSPESDAGIVRLSYTPRGKGIRKEKLMLVGKGICYDTGGTNLKPANYMFGMHEDMQGSAVALGTLMALTQLEVNFPVECWMALAMNHIGPKAYKPNDVVTASDGTTIEIVHTDAEGRMVLADTLAMASREKPALIIDYATLTGACIYSLGTAYSGIFTNRDELLDTLIAAGKDSGERVWPFPMDEDYDKLLDSDIADIKQCAREGGADHILATRFLQRFVKHKTRWIHIDLSSSNRKGGLAHIPTDTTGFGVRYTLNLLLDKKIM